ncbi:Hypothetical protein FKW44_007058 [Caligus rogercresseyi]|uniref:Uncharacterized protein n=1 Tax=Caligus rogercresseyi TaxID=217165 RepID=A0A7T8KEG5_CALRO|nr:Hypothetical protein FKW44_007058 [Caligus rogercresseyi]
MDFVNKVQEIIDEEPTRSLSTIAEELEAGETTFKIVCKKICVANRIGPWFPTVVQWTPWGSTKA